jgi:hypothetical protein
LRNIRQRYLQIVAHYDGCDDRFAIPAAIVAATASATAEIPGNPRNYVDYDGYDAKMGRKVRFALEGSKAMNKDMLDRLRSAVREGSQKSAEPRPDKAAVPMTTLVSTPSEAEDRIGPSFYSQADLDAARRAAEQLGYGIGLKPARANPPAVAVRHDELAARAEAELVHLGHYSTGNGMIRVTYGSSCKATQLGGMENAPKGLARMILAEQVREATRP